MLVKEKEKIEKEVGRDPDSKLETKKKIERINIVLDEDIPYLF